MDTKDVEMNDEAAALEADTMFESFFDNDSGAWSLRRVSSVPPRADDVDAT